MKKLSFWQKLKDQGILSKPPKVGEIVEGKVIEMKKAAVYLDLGAFGTGIIYGKEFYEAKENLKDLKIGDQIFAKVIELDNEEGYIELSLKQAGKELSWEALKQIKEKDQTLRIKISGANKGGLLAEVMGISAFLPVSQLSPEHYPRVEGGDLTKILAQLQKFVGKELMVKIFDLDPNEEKLILSEKAKTFSEIKEIIKNYQIGEIVEGEIVGLADFGAFIKFNKESLPFIEGLIHISELDWQLIEDPAQILKVGQRVKAKIIKIANGRVFLSLKALKKDPWEGIEKKFKKGEVISGKVIKFNPFGALVEVSPKIQGLVHISEFGSQTKMESVLKIGKKYNFRISSIEPDQHRMILKLVKE